MDLSIKVRSAFASSRTGEGMINLVEGGIRAFEGGKALPLVESAEESSTNTITVSPSAKEADVRLRVEGSRPYGFGDTLVS